MQVVWYAWPTSVFAAAGLTYWLYRTLWGKGATWKVAAILRFLALFFLFFWIFNPSWEGETESSQRAVWQVYADVSSSDSAEVTRVVNNLKNQTSNVNNVQFKFWAFSDAVVPYENRDSLNSQVSRVDKVNQHISRLRSPSKLAMVITDGIVNSGQSVLNSSGSKQRAEIPVFTIGVGDTNVYPDLELGSILANKSVFSGNKTEIEIKARALKAIGNIAKLSLNVGGKEVLLEKWGITQFNQVKSWKTNISPPINEGVFWLEAKLEPVTNEKNTVNNTLRIPIEVKKDIKKIHFVYGETHPDIGVLKRALAGQKQYEIKTYSEREGLDLSADVYVLHGVKSRTLLKQVSAVSKPFWYFASNQSSIRTAIEMSPYAVKKPVRFTSGFQSVTPRLNEGFDFFDLDVSSDRKTLWSVVNSPLAVWQVPDANIVIYQNWNGIQTQYPLAFTHDGEIASSWFIGSGIWRWRSNEMRLNKNAKQFDQWVVQNIQYLSRSSSRVRGIEILNHHHQVNAGETLELKWVYRDDAGNQVSDQTFEVLATVGDKEQKLNYQIENSVYQAYINAPLKGEMRVSIRSKRGEQSRFIWEVNENSLEDRNTLANHSKLRAWSKETNGLFLTDSMNLDEIMPLANKNKWDARVLSVKYDWWSLEESWVFLTFLFSLFSLEWFLRKWLGKI